MDKMIENRPDPRTVEKSTRPTQSLHPKPDSPISPAATQALTPVRRNAGLLVFDPPKSFPPINPEQVKRLAEEW
jgi:hypothetical protein